MVATAEPVAPDDTLMPERAEDIDLIANWMAGGDDQLRIRPTVTI
jgi:hypothetical protein